MQTCTGSRFYGIKNITAKYHFLLYLFNLFILFDIKQMGFWLYII